MDPSHYLDDWAIRPFSSALRRQPLCGAPPAPPWVENPPEGANAPRNELDPPDGLEWASAEAPSLGRAVQLTRHDIRLDERNAVIRTGDRSSAELADFVKWVRGHYRAKAFEDWVGDRRCADSEVLEGLPEVGERADALAEH
ncbi:unnamed protein product [Prorocentrum cordatum]|uniref:Uncharacterized protein n=1 Tax=Prorocentrum cordatum TaxID=2364126 RepID=A0ABN9XHI3_9DINO|nr:unnamed protein product [Polarella glacialis]